MHAGSMDRIGSSFAFASLSAAAVGAALSLAGCSAPRTWPSVTGDQGISADAPPLPQVVIDALKHAHKEIAGGAPLVYNLPQEINVAAFATYERGLAPGKPMCPGDRDAWTVRQARIDGGKAQVDIEYPTAEGIYQTVTVHLSGASGGIGYRPDYLQFWKVPVKAPTCQTPVPVVERTCGEAAARALAAERASAAKAQAAPAAPAAVPAPPKATSGGDEPSK
jgi:hypothetical protein